MKKIRVIIHTDITDESKFKSYGESLLMILNAMMINLLKERGKFLSF